MKNDVSLRCLARVAMVLELLLGVGAVGGGIALMAGPRGEILPLPLSALDGSPFADYFAPGMILFVILGLGSLGAALVAWKRRSLAPLLAVGAGCALLIWIVVEIAIIGYSNHPPLQALYLGLGVVMTLVGAAWLRLARRKKSSSRGRFSGTTSKLTLRGEPRAAARWGGRR
jgi:hypothetical protein